MRLLRQGTGVVGLAGPGHGPARVERLFEKVLDMPHGIALVTGPTGSGKTTTLYSALNQINDSVRKIITIEDPVEYQLKGINQIQVSEKAGHDVRAGGCARSCVTIPMWCSSVKSAIRKPRRLRCRRRSPATWFSQPCTPTTRRVP